MSSVITDVAGSVWKIVCQVGDMVNDGDELVIVESMKMEIPVESPVAGKISEILVAEGEAIQEGQVVVRIEPSKP